MNFVIFFIQLSSPRDKEDYSTLSRPFHIPRVLSTSSHHAYTGTVPPLTPGSGRGVYDYSSNVDIKSATTFEPGRVPRTNTYPLVDMTNIRRASGLSSRSGSFSSVDSSEMTYANTKMSNELKKFDDPVYEYIKGSEEEFAHNPLYDTSDKFSSP